MVTTRNGLGGLIVVLLVEEVPKHGQEVAPILLHSTVEKIVMNWDPPIRHKNVTQTLVVNIFLYKEIENWRGWHLELELESHFTILDSP